MTSQFLPFYPQKRAFCPSFAENVPEAALNQSTFRGVDGQRGTADNASIVTRFGWDHLEMLVINRRSTLANRTLDRLKDRRAGFCDTPANNNPIWVQQPGDVRVPGSPAPRAQTSGCPLRRIATSRKTAATRPSALSYVRVGIGSDRADFTSRNHAGLHTGPTKVDPNCDFRAHQRAGFPMLRFAIIRKPSSVRLG